ncbi:MAG: hypothetical protein ABWZ64_17700 [Xanthobacteraceae bacterium]|jgi:hypothetical protein
MRKPKPDAEERARDAAAATAEYHAKVAATRTNTIRLRELRLAKETKQANEAKQTKDAKQLADKTAAGGRRPAKSKASRT